jgi:hypothetical protein
LYPDNLVLDDGYASAYSSGGDGVLRGSRSKRGIFDIISDLMSSVGRGITNTMHMGGRKVN